MASQRASASTATKWEYRLGVAGAARVRAQEELAKAEDELRKTVKAADRARVPRQRIAAAAGLARRTVYKWLGLEA